MMRLYLGCGTRRLTSTTMVLVILVETTWPIFSFLILACCCSAILFLRSRRRLRLPGPRQFPLAQHGENARANLPHAADLLQAVHLPHRHLKVETKQLLFHFGELAPQFQIVEIAKLLRLHIRSEEHT